MLAFSQFGRLPPKQATTPTPVSAAHSPVIAAVVARLLNVKKPSHVKQVLGRIISDDAVYDEHIRALLTALQASPNSAPDADAETERLLAPLNPLAEAINLALGQAQAAVMMGIASPHHNTLALRASETYSQNAPPPAVMLWVAAYQKVPLAVLLSFYIGRHVSEAPDSLRQALVQVIEEGYQARLVHLASLGYNVPPSLVPPEQRSDIEALYDDHEMWKQELHEESKLFVEHRTTPKATP